MSVDVKRWLPEAFVQKYRDVWLPEIGITSAELRDRLANEFRQGEVEITDEIRDKLRSP
jgi:hypothetical protein